MSFAIRSLLLGGLLVGCRASSFSAGDEEAIVGVLEAQRDAWNRGDLGAFMDGYWRSPELTFTSGGEVRRGWQVTHDRYVERYGQSPGDMGTLAFTELEVTGLGPDAAMVMGRWTLTETPKGGTGIFTLAFRRLPDGWKVVHDHTSAEKSKTPPSTE